MLGLRYLDDFSAMTVVAVDFSAWLAIWPIKFAIKFLKLMGSALGSTKEQYAKPGHTAISSCFPRGSKLTSVFTLFRVFWVKFQECGCQSPTTSPQEFCCCSIWCFFLAVLKADAALAISDNWLAGHPLPASGEPFVAMHSFFGHDCCCCWFLCLVWNRIVGAASHLQHH